MLYDVWFRPVECAVVCIEADSPEEAKRIVMDNDDYTVLSPEEIKERMSNAYDFYGMELEVVNVEEVTK